MMNRVVVVKRDRHSTGGSSNVARMLPVERNGSETKGAYKAVSIYNPERQWPRLIPANAVMVSIFSGTEQAYGLLANISEVGACFVSGVQHVPGDA